VLNVALVKRASGRRPAAVPAERRVAARPS